MSNFKPKIKWLDRLAYTYIGKYIEGRLDHYEDMRLRLRKAGINKSLRMYLAVAIFQSILVFLASFLLLLLISITLIITGSTISFFNLIFLVIVIPIMFGIVTYLFNFFYPSYKINERKVKLEASLPTASSYMTALASAGVLPAKIFLSLSQDTVDLYIKSDARLISRDIEIFNMDIIRALESASRRSPSAKYASFLEGIISTFTSGGDLQIYLQSASQSLMRDKVATEKAFVDSLGLIAELFLVGCIVLPTFVVVVIAMLGINGSFSHSYLSVIVAGLAFFGIPLLQIIIVILVDGLQPEL